MVAATSRKRAALSLGIADVRTLSRGGERRGDWSVANGGGGRRYRRPAERTF